MTRVNPALRQDPQNPNTGKDTELPDNTDNPDGKDSKKNLNGMPKTGESKVERVWIIVLIAIVCISGTASLVYFFKKRKHYEQ